MESVQAENPIERFQVFEILPHLIRFMEKSQKLIRKSPLIYKDTYRYAESLQSDIQRFIPHQWGELKKNNSGEVCRHTLRMFSAFAIDPLFSALNPYDQNILLLTTLFHDIGKRGQGPKSKDPFHPYRSCSITLTILKRSNLINIPSQTIKLTKSLILSLKSNPQPSSSSSLHPILSHLFYLSNLIHSPTQTWTSYRSLTQNIPQQSIFPLQILLLVLFHQSFTVCRSFPNKYLLTPLQIQQYFSFRLLNLLEFIMKNDSLSYMLFSPQKREAYRREISNSFENIRKLL